MSIPFEQMRILQSTININVSLNVDFKGAVQMIHSYQPIMTNDSCLIVPVAADDTGSMLDNDESTIIVSTHAENIWSTHGCWKILLDSWLIREHPKESISFRPCIDVSSVHEYLLPGSSSIIFHVSQGVLYMRVIYPHVIGNVGHSTQLLLWVDK